MFHDLGGRMDMFHLSPEKAIAGIFIKNVLAESPAGRSGALKTGDRILQVCSSIDVLLLLLALEMSDCMLIYSSLLWWIKRYPVDLCCLILLSNFEEIEWTRCSTFFI